MITGEQIRHARERADLTQEQLAQLVNVSLRSVGNWERGLSVPRAKSLTLQAVLGEYLELDPDAPKLSSASDAELLAEIARRFSRPNEREGRVSP